MQKDYHNNKEITLNDLASLIQKLDLKIESTNKATIESLENKIESTRNEIIKTLTVRIDSATEELATLTQKQFLELGEKIDAIKKKTDHIEAELNKKTDKITYNTIKYRVEKLEEKFA